MLSLHFALQFDSAGATQDPHNKQIQLQAVCFHCCKMICRIGIMYAMCLHKKNNPLYSFVFLSDNLCFYASVLCSETFGWLVIPHFESKKEHWRKLIEIWCRPLLVIKCKS